MGKSVREASDLLEGSIPTGQGVKLPPPTHSPHENKT